MGIIDLFFHLSELIVGALLVIIGVKLINVDFLKELKNEKLFVYFLLVWAATFFFLGLYVIIDFGSSLGYVENVIAFLAGIASLFAGVVLGFFSWKLLNRENN